MASSMNKGLSASNNNGASASKDTTLIGRDDKNRWNTGSPVSGIQGWMCTISKGLDLKPIIDKIVAKDDTGIDTKSIKCFTYCDGVLYFVLDDNYGQSLVVLNVERWKEMSLNTPLEEIVKLLEKKEVLLFYPISPVNSFNSNVNESGWKEAAGPKNEAVGPKNEAVGDVFKIVVNVPGVLAALICKYYFSVLTIYPLSSATAPKFVKRCWVNPSTVYVDALWNTLSRAHNHLSVLTANGTLMIYNCFDESRDPEQTYTFVLNNPQPEYTIMSASTTKIQFGKQWGLPQANLISNTNSSAAINNKKNKKEEFISLTFSYLAESGWKAFNAYAVTCCGSVGMICGIMPNNMSITKEDLAVLEEQCPIFNFKSNDSNSISPDDAQEYWQMRFYQELVSQIDLTQKKHNPGELIAVKRPMQNMKLDPYALYNYPKSDTIVTDIACINLNYLNLLILSTTTGHFYVGIDVTWSLPIFRLSSENFSERKHQLNIEWIECINLKTDKANRTISKNENFNNASLLITERVPYTVYVILKNAVHAVNLSPLIEALGKAHKEFITSPTTAHLPKERFPPSIVECIYQVRAPEKDSNYNLEKKAYISAFAVTSDVYCDNTYITISDTLILSGGYIQPTSSLHKFNASDKALPLTCLTSHETVDQYVCPIISDLCPKYAGSNLEAIAEYLNFKNLKYPEFACLASLSLLYDIYEKFHISITSMVTHLGELSKRLSLFGKEIECQKVLLAEFAKPDTLAKLKVEILERMKRLETYEKRQLLLNERSFSLLRLTLDCSNRLTEEELKWLKDLSATNKRINNFYKPQVTHLYSKWCVIKHIVNKIKAELSVMEKEIIANENQDSHEMSQQDLLNIYDEAVRRSEVLRKVKERLVFINQTLESKFAEARSH